MDWRLRRYYVVVLPTCNYDIYTKQIKDIPSLKLHPATYPPQKITNGIYSRQFTDEFEPRGYYHYMVSVHGSLNPIFNHCMNLIARQCAELGWSFKWKEIYPCGKRRKYTDD